jgi:hypothetical protein
MIVVDRTKENMIHIFFVPGMFGSTIEYVLNDYTSELTPTNATIKHDGSMHTFKKQNHLDSRSMLANMTMDKINTPIYPFLDMHLGEVLKEYSICSDDYCILLYAKSFEDAEKNMLFQYHKIATQYKSGLQIFYSTAANEPRDVKQWNQAYTKYSDLSPWEFREWFSIFYPSWVSSWQTSVDQVSDRWLKIPCSDVLNNTKQTFETIIEFCNLTKQGNLDEFVMAWRQAQQYIIDEYQLLDNIVTNTLSQTPFTWRPISIIGEAIVQQRIRQQGFEICCNGLDNFPTDSIELYNLLDNCLKLHQQQEQL